MLKVRLIVLTECSNVTDGRTDGQTDGRTPHDGMGRNCIASLGKNDRRNKKYSPWRLVTSGL